jgi:ArsR family transcriptional regulator, arsenate/arsenite/antimonite-responsive transcriptional repressor
MNRESGFTSLATVLQLSLFIDISRFMDKNAAIDALSALAHGARLDAFRLLLSAAPGELAAGDISAQLKTVQNTMSTHLAILERTGLVSSRRAGRNVLYRAEPGAMRDLLAWLMEDCCQGDPEICRPLMAALTCNDC